MFISSSPKNYDNYEKKKKGNWGEEPLWKEGNPFLLFSRRGEECNFGFVKEVPDPS